MHRTTNGTPHGLMIALSVITGPPQRKLTTSSPSSNTSVFVLLLKTHTSNYFVGPTERTFSFRLRLLLLLLTTLPLHLSQINALLRMGAERRTKHAQRWANQRLTSTAAAGRGISGAECDGNISVSRTPTSPEPSRSFCLFIQILEEFQYFGLYFWSCVFSALHLRISFALSPPNNPNNNNHHRSMLGSGTPIGLTWTRMV